MFERLGLLWAVVTFVLTERRLRTDESGQGPVLILVIIVIVLLIVVFFLLGLLIG